jgi:Sigma-70 region 2
MELVRNRSEADDVVAETFAKILDLLHRGGGPDDAFRPYLLTAVRRAAYDRHRAERRQLVTDEMDAFDRGVPFADPAVADLERTMIARAFASLPERWQAYLQIAAATPLAPPASPGPPPPLLYPRPGTPRPRPACWAVLVVRRSSHEAHAALAPGGVT